MNGINIYIRRQEYDVRKHLSKVSRSINVQMNHDEWDEEDRFYPFRFMDFIEGIDADITNSIDADERIGHVINAAILDKCLDLPW